jgi:pyridoxamine 5'-phosphate oxidase
MTRSEVLEFVRRNPVSMMATVEDGEPRVRGMATPIVDDDGLTFCTGAEKGVSRQLLADPAVELCYWSQEEKIQLRIRGRMERLDDEVLKKRIVETVFTFLKPIVAERGWESLILFRLSRGRVFEWRADGAGVCPEPIDF